MNLLQKLRITFASLFITLITLLFLDFTGTIHLYLGWLAKVQFLPALLAGNVVIIAGLILLTLIFGRIYCSVICPLGIFQDIISRFRRKKNKFRFAKAFTWLRYAVLGLLIVGFIANIGSLVALLDPYSAFGRMAANLLSPLYLWGNNLLALAAENINSYAFYEVEVWIKGIGILAIAIITFIAIIILAWKNGRIYCNAICPVGTVLGLLSKLSIYKHRINLQNCNSCGLCARNCKSSCINPKEHTIDYSRCVSCFNCIDKCNKGAITYTASWIKKEERVKNTTEVNSSLRSALTMAGTLAATSTVVAQAKKVDGGLAFIEDKKKPKRQTPILPPGAQSLRHFFKHCTGCQLCVNVCSNQVLRPSVNLLTFMQPELSYERGYCRPECTKCSEVCPVGAILPITVEDKSSIQIGHAVWIEKNCVVLTDNVDCGNCARHCPVAAITMIEKEPDSLDEKKIPMVNTERCIGCGACENLCPARPFSAIYVEGHTMHRSV